MNGIRKYVEQISHQAHCAELIFVAYLTELELLRVLLRLQDDPLIVAYTR